jgi:hypothetical protein
MTVFTQLPIARYRFTFQVTEPIGLQHYAGSALRGAFGHALRQLGCVTKARTCTGCTLLSSCPYPLVFTPHDIPREQSGFNTIAQIPVPYIIEPPSLGAKRLAEGALLSFNMVLMGAALPQLALIILAWRRALLRGLGPADGKADLLTVELLTANTTSIIYSEAAPSVLPHDTHLNVPAYEAPQDVHLHFTTPLRIQKDKKLLGARDITAPLLLRNLIRRASLLAQFQFNQPLAFDVQQFNALADSVSDDRRLAWQDWSRYSSRQQQRMDLGGVTGHWLLRAVPAPLLPFLYVGQWLHVGKETSFGLGSYQIVDTPWKPAPAEEAV